jgi:vacuolar-type H+-ATPase subunit E/Vma4
VPGARDQQARCGSSPTRRPARRGDRAAFDLAERRLEAIGNGEQEHGRWEAAIGRLVAETAALVGSGELRLRPADLELVSDILVGPQRVALSLVADATLPAGVRGRSTDGRVTVDATVPERMRRAREVLVPEVAAGLRDEGLAPRPLVAGRP